MFVSMLESGLFFFFEYRNRAGTRAKLFQGPQEGSCLNGSLIFAFNEFLYLYNGLVSMITRRYFRQATRVLRL